MAQKVWRLSVSVFVHDRYSHAGNCTGLPSNIGLVLSIGDLYLFLLERHLVLSILDHCPCFDFPVSGDTFLHHRFFNF